MFTFVVWKVLFKNFRKFLDTLKLIPSSVRKNLRYLPPFNQEMFQYQIHFKGLLFSLYQLIFQKHLQFLHIQTRQYILLFFEITVNFLPTAFLIKLRHFLHSLTACSYFRFSIYFSIGLSLKVLSTSFNRNTE